MDVAPVQGGGFLQSYHPTTGKERGRFTDGRIAVVENRHGKGRTLRVGTNPGIGYFRTSCAESLRYFAAAFAWTGRTRRVELDNPVLQARLQDGPSGRALWVLNPTRSAQSANVTVDGWPVEFGTTHWPCDQEPAGGSRIAVSPRDAVVVELKPQ